MVREETVFGPIFSRRLGSSLGINLLPRNGKICNFDCIYCECGWNRDGLAGRRLPTAAEVRGALESKLRQVVADNIHVDSITFSGDGELAGRFRRWYQDQMARPAIAWEDLRWEEAAQTMARWASQAQAFWEEDEEAALTGQGGWWPQEDPLDQGAPQGASLSRYLLASPAQYPVYGQVTCAYGWRYHPITGNPDFHNGMDIAAPLGSGIYTAFPGTVTDRGESAIYGNYIEVTHSNSLRTVYCHCQELLAPEGANLRAGEPQLQTAAGVSPVRTRQSTPPSFK